MVRIVALATALALWMWTYILWVPSPFEFYPSFRSDPIQGHVTVLVVGTTVGILGVAQRKRRRLLAGVALALLAINAAAMTGLCLCLDVP